MSLFSKKAYVGLDIGHHTLKAVQVERTVSGWRVAKVATARTPADTVRDSVVVDPTVLGLAIKNMLKGAHMTATSAGIAISGGTVVVRPVRMPKMAESALRKSIRFEASRYVPNSIEDSYIEFEIVGDVDAVNMDVLVAAAPRELVDSRIAACEHAGLEVENVEIAAFAVYRSIIESDHAQAWNDKTVGLVDIGAQITNLGVVSHGVFSMTRAIPAGGQVLTDTLKSYFKLSDEDAESGKGQLDVRGLMTEGGATENPPLRVLHSHVDDMVREVRRSINYWQSQQGEANSAKQVDVLVLCGGGANFKGLAEYFEHKLGIHTVSQGIYDNPRFLGSHGEFEHGTELGVAVGLAMGLAPTKVVPATPAKPQKAKAEKPAKAEKAPKPPKDPKPSKPPRGKTFKVTREVEEASVDAPVEISTPPVEERELVSATAEAVPTAFAPAAPAPVAEAPVFETPVAVQPEPIVEAPVAVQPEPIVEAPIEVAPEPIVEAPVAEEVTPEPVVEEPLVQPIEAEAPVEEAPARPAQPEPPQPRTFARASSTPTAQPAPKPTNESDEIAAEYGGEVAALLGAFDAAPAIEVMKEEAAAPLPQSEAEVKALLAEAFTEHAESEPAQVEIISEAAPVQVAPVAQAVDERSALLTEPTPAAPAAEPAKATGKTKSLAGWLGVGKSAGEPKDKPVKEKPVKAVKEKKEAAPRKPMFGKKADEAPVQKAEAATKPTEKKKLFSVGAKAEKPAKEAKVKPEKAPKATKEPGEKKGVGVLVSWLMGSPKQDHVKPTGVLTPKAPITPMIPEAAETPVSGPRIELLKGSDLESNQPMPTVSAENLVVENDEQPAAMAAERKPKARKSTAKKAQPAESDEAPKKEAA